MAIRLGYKIERDNDQSTVSPVQNFIKWMMKYDNDDGVYTSIILLVFIEILCDTWLIQYVI